MNTMEKSIGNNGGMILRDKVQAKGLTIELKGVRVSVSGSHETTNYVADVYINGIKAFAAENDGQGGSDLYIQYKGRRDLLDKAEQYAKELPPMKDEDFPDGLEMNLEMLIGELLAEWEKAKIVKSIMKKAVKHTVYTRPGMAEGAYAYIKAPRTPETDAYVARKYPDAVILKPELVTK